ncbi:MAG: cell division protein FtsA [Rhodospirillales bacterium]
MNWRRKNAKVRHGLVAALDIGTSKVCCLIARADENGRAKIEGIGHQSSQGVRLGAVVDMARTDAAIRAAVESAEQMAGDTIDAAVINVSCGKPHSRLIAYEVSISGHQIDEADIRKVLDPGCYANETPHERELLHAVPVGYTVDGARGVSDPIGMWGDRLGVNVHLVTAERGPLRNLEAAVASCRLAVADMVVTPLASAEACLVEDERRLGATMIDMGAGTTSIACFFDGELIHTDVISVGGAHVTGDIAQGLSTPLHHAERMKTLYGHAVPSASDDQAVLEVPLIGEDDAHDIHQVPRSMLVGIIRPRVEEIFELVKSRLATARFERIAGPRVVLTGGASQLPGVADIAARILNKQVRISRPRPIAGLAESVSGPAFACAAGLLQHAINPPRDAHSAAFHPQDDPGGGIGRLGQWFRENF